MEKPITTDGITVKTDGDKICYSTHYIPLSATSARKMLEAKNAKLPTHLKMKFSEVEKLPESEALGLAAKETNAGN